VRDVLAHAVPGGRVEQEALRMLAAGDGFDESEYGRLFAATWKGARSRAGQDEVLTAIVEKIEHPDRFSPTLGFRNEGAAEIRGPGGFDRVPVGFYGSAGEHLYVTTQPLTDLLR